MRRWPSSKPRAWTCSGRINATKASSPAAAPISTIPTTTRSKSFISLTERKAEMARKLELTFACGDYEIMRALKEGSVRPEGIELTVLTDMAPSPRHWRFLRGRQVDLGEGAGLGFGGGRGPGSSVPRDSGFSPSPLPSWLHLRQYVEGHQQADRPHRPQGRDQGLFVHRRAVDARHPRARLRRAAQIDRVAQ